MIIHIKVIAKAKRNFVKEVKGGLKVYVTSPPEKGKANVAVVEQLSKHFGIKDYQINIVSGQHSRNKVIEIPNH
ncbi:MAG: DUF167 domain-containing protein [Candidatus Omnitrophica bacterium]|nr:DUF167 domain-containing protein [Candidatus Omnitrophota bacterium]